jgi:arylsulfatase A-like enzyme
LALAIDRYATFDPSFTVLLDVFRPLVSDGEFFNVLRRVGDATDDRSLRAVPLQLADARALHPTIRPHIFVVVVDSLRPDYLSPYNPAVTFTPAIDAFARESTVMQRAFTPYAGTALSQPALWAGGLIPRAMYVKPFADVNNLERLLRAGGYRRYISVDEILSLILEDWQDVVRLDAHIAQPEREEEAFKFDLCTTVGELSRRLEADGTDTPVFFYSQPQSVHIRALAPDHYPGTRNERTGTAQLFKPAVDAISRIDGCFGNLVQFLKRRDVYDQSIIVLTSDHGDSYGEAGRWGHAFYVAPEILRIPLIIRVPDALRADRRSDPHAVALLTDLTPTLYDLLGIGTSTGPLLGRSLLPRSTAPPAPSNDMFLIQSSYSRVFGLLDGAGDWLYTADANRLREEFYDLREGGTVAQSIPDSLRYRRSLLERLRQLDRYYGHPDVE